jgi:putative membrane protein
MKKFTHPDFQTRLGKLIAELEQASHIEVVVLIKPRSGNYDDVPLGLGANLSMLMFSYLFLVDTHFDSYQVYFMTLAAFGLGMLSSWALPFMQRLLAGKKRKQRNVEIMARALFQKGGLHHTSTKVGTLIYVSSLEKMVYIVADRGAQMAIPEAEWQTINTSLASIFTAKNPPEALLIELAKCRDIFHQYIPALENNINELPDDLSIDL